MTEAKKDGKFLLVPGNPSNPFNDPWNVGVLCGSVTGLVSGYLLAGKIFPLIKRTVSAAFIGKTKLVLVVNSELKMSKGKVGSQCGHATLMSYKKMTSSWRPSWMDAGMLASWEISGQPKVVLQAPNLTAIRELEKVAKSRSIPVCFVRDAGRTQVPQASLTVMALGPAPELLLDSITGHLRLL